MEWPIQPVEIQRRFAPRFCPRRNCPAHQGFDRIPSPAAVDAAGRRARSGAPFHQIGSFTRADGRRVVRYHCLVGDHGFSKQSFAVSYYLKRPELIVPVAAGLQAGSAHRHIARSPRCAPSTVTRLSARIGRHALLFQAMSLSALGPLDESVVFDHFEVFARSQDYPFGIATPVGSESWFVYGVDPAPHARTGRLTPAQLARQRVLPRQPRRGGYAGSTRRILDILLGISPAKATA